MRYLAPGHGKTKQGYFWTANRPGGEVLYHWETSRAAACLENVLPVDFTGTVQCDGYSAYDAFARQRAGTITLADCWAHVRRKFFDAKESAPRTAGWILRQIQHLYRIEARLREGRCSPNPHRHPGRVGQGTGADPASGAQARIIDARGCIALASTHPLAQPLVNRGHD